MVNYIQVILNGLSRVYLCFYIYVMELKNHVMNCEREEGLGYMGKVEGRKGKGENNVMKFNSRGESA